MTKEDRQVFVKALRAIEQLQFRNFALESLLEKFGPPGWSRLADEVANDEQIHPDIREKFRRRYKDLERDDPQPDSAQQALLNFLLSFPSKGKPN
ncbi:MAG TPA: hypothetical protein VKI40_00600 [Terriglobales bacterium]|nr:hypothetical protein [Terriglobales bacterium]